MKNLIACYTVLLFVFVAACQQEEAPESQAVFDYGEQQIKEVTAVADVPVLPRSMDILAEAERQLSLKHNRKASDKLSAGIKALKAEVGSTTEYGFLQAIRTLEKFQAILAADQPVYPDSLHKAVVDALSFSSIELQDTVVNRAVEVNNPGGVLPKLYKSESQ